MTVIPWGTPGPCRSAPNCSGVPSRSSAGSRSRITRCASRITTGSAHAPPIQPCTRPSAVMIAREPSFPEEGACRQTTVARANSSPRPAISAAVDSTSQPSSRRTWSRRRFGHQESVLIGGAPDTSWPLGDGLVDPVGQQRHVDVADPRPLQSIHHGVHERRRAAHRGALADALGADRVVRARGDDLVQLVARRLPGGGQQVVHEVGADAVAVLVEGDELHRRHGVGLGQATHDLALDDHRVDPYPAVVDGDEVEHVPHAGHGVDLDGADVAGERPGQVGRVVVGVGLEARLEAVGHVGVRRHRALLDAHASVGRAADVEAAQLPVDVLLGDLEQVGGQPPRLGPDLAGDHRDGRTGDGRAARGVGAHPERRGVGVALLDDDVLGRDAELVGDDLGPGGLVSLPLGLGAGAEDRLAGHVHPQLGGVEHLDAEDVVLAAVARPERLGHRRDPDAEQPAASLGLLLLPLEVVVADRPGDRRRGTWRTGRSRSGSRTPCGTGSRRP